MRQVEGSPENVFLDVATCKSAVAVGYTREELVGAYLSGSVARVPNIVPTLATRPIPRTTQGFAVKSL